MASGANIRLIIKHPTIDPGEITSVLGVRPDVCWSRGEAKITDRGEKFGVRKYSMWSLSVPVLSHEDLSSKISSIITIIRPHHEWVSRICSECGQFLLTVDLPGANNIGAVISVESLKCLSDMGISLGFEVFP